MAISGILLSAVVLADDPFAIDEGGVSSDVVTVDKTSQLPNAQVTKSDLHRLQPFLDKLPEGYRLRLDFVTVAPGGTAIRYIERLTPLNAAGQADGDEYVFSNWYQGPRQVTAWRAGKQHGLERYYTGDGKQVTIEVPWEDGLIDGVKRTFHGPGQLATEAHYEHGKATGEALTFSASGDLLRRAHFRNGNRDGEVVDYWPGADQVKRVVTYKDGAVDGVSRGYYKSGQLKWRREFRQNQLDGVEEHFTADGELEARKHWRAGELVSSE